MFLELVVDDRTEAPVMEAFFSDATGALTVNTFDRTSVPIEVLREFLAEAQRLFPPIGKSATDAATPTI
ncbi:MAG: hypothetical protein ACJ8NS_04755 [Chthoniobacterales bacterium]